MTKYSDKDPTRHVVDLAATGVPLESGLRALAEEVGLFAGKRLNGIADRLARGESLAEILNDIASANSRFVVMALQSGSDAADPTCSDSTWLGGTVNPQ